MIRVELLKEHAQNPTLNFSGAGKCYGNLDCKFSNDEINSKRDLDRSERKRQKLNNYNNYKSINGNNSSNNASSNGSNSSSKYGPIGIDNGPSINDNNNNSSSSTNQIN